LDLTNIVIFVAVFVGFLIVVRRLFSSDEAYPSSADLMHAAKEPPGGESPSRSALTGADIPFPVKVPPVEYLGGGNYNRPILRNYYFSKTDLVRGPDKRDAFCDDLFLQMENPGSGYVREDQYTVGTPAGFEELLRTDPHNSILIIGKILVVPKWDLAMILKEIMDDVLEKHEIVNSEQDDDQQARS